MSDGSKNLETTSPGAPAGAAAYDNLATRLSKAVTLNPLTIAKYGDHPSQSLEIFAPAELPSAKLPVLVFLHGGAWIAGGLHWLRFMAPAAVSLPAIFVGVTYRLAPEHQWPAQYEDARDALLWVRSHVAQYGGDPERMVVAGHSAGGQLASMVVLRGEAGSFSGCMPVSSPFDLRYGDVDETSSQSRVYKFLLSRRADDADASPILFTAGNTTPFHLVWGENDMPHIRTAGANMIEALASQHGEVTSHVYPIDDHFATHTRLADSTDAWYARLHNLFATPSASPEQP